MPGLFNNISDRIGTMVRSPSTSSFSFNTSKRRDSQFIVSPESSASNSAAPSLPSTPATTPHHAFIDSSPSSSSSPYHNPRLDLSNPRFSDESLPLSSNPATRFRQLLARPGIVVAPGVCDGISARAALLEGFNCLYQSGAATTASRLGMPDLAIANCSDFTSAAETICSLSPSTPVIADADVGFGGPINIARTVKAYIRAGLAALHIEDQVQFKRCGHLTGKQVVSREDFIVRVKAAVQARDSVPDSDFVIIARTDSLHVLGYEEAIWRLRAAKEVGADACFIEGASSAKMVTDVVEALSPTPVLVNVISGGYTPSFTIQECEALGAKIMIFSLVSCIPMLNAVRAAMRSLRETGNDKEALAGMKPTQFFEAMGLRDVTQIDSDAGNALYKTL